MSTDRILLLVGVNGVILAVLATGFWLLLPSMGGSSTSTLNTTKGVGGIFLGAFKLLGMRLSPASRASSLQRLLDAAGNPGKWSVEKLFAVKTLSLLISSGLAFLVSMTKYGLLDFHTLGITVGFGVAGFFIPDLLLYNAGTKRQQKIQKSLPDTLDLMSVSMRAGLGFDAAISKVSANSSGPLSEEFARMLQEFRLGGSRAEVLRRLGERSTVADLRHVVQALVQADKLGIPIAGVLTQLALDMRVKRRQRAEEKAQKVTVKVIFPTLLCILPALMSVVMGPAVISIYHSFSG